MAPSALPEGEDAPADGSLPASSLAELGARPLRAYVHVPLCATRCGYCDFNTYTPRELGGALDAARESYVAAALAEIALAGRVLAGAQEPAKVGPLASVFLGGGTPTLLPPAQPAALLDALRSTFGLAPDAEVTTEANPDSVTPESLAALRAAGYTRISFGMQSSVPRVLAVLDRTHSPGRAVEAVRWAREAGFDSVSLDVIYGTPGESDADWRATLDTVLGAEPDHVSAYSLIVEDGTPLARRVRSGQLAAPDDDVHADRYVIADEVLSAAGYRWYEVSNWARPAAPCRHNLGYWHGDDWWGIGPGAHSHVGGTRWWNVKHPRSYADRLAAGHSPAAGREVLDADARRIERVLLELRLAEGLPLEVLTASERRRVPALVARGLAGDRADRLVLTRPGRLLADAVIRDLLD